MGQRKDQLKASRTAAKVGMASSLAVLVYTGFKGGRKAMNLHTWAGMGLLGFTLWHVYLYQPRKRAAIARHAKARADISRVKA
ncbi:hypothetical protein D5125_10970 [Magnetovirga frankeli]|uniref:hypothetical protein n=1 Tax=Magnetovirga frankeli TaxID=947516 RepID=UPI0012936FC7|nr:hypothetical protein D5125_10970 [gamma proteobacterium SS-5]